MKIHLICGCLITMALFLFVGPVHASSWYVRSTAACPTNGNGSASGCASSASGAGAWSGFASISCASIAAGDTLNLVSGDTYTGGGISVGKSGSAGNPITITVSGGGTAVINASGGTGISINGNSYITVDGVIGTPAFGGSTSMGISIINIGASGWCVYENSGGGHDKILHVECYGTSPGTSEPDDNRGGLFLGGGGGNWEIAYNYIHGPALAQYSSSKWGATCLSGWQNDGSNSFTSNLIHDNNCTQMYNDGLRCNGDCSIYHNEVSHIDGSGHSDSLLCQSGSYCAIYSNYVHDSGDQNVYLDNLYDSACHHVRVYDNIFNSNPGFGMNMDPEGGAGAAPSSTGCTGSGASAWDDVVFANNTVYSVSAYGIYWSGRGSVTNAVIVNNIFGTNTDGGYWPVYLRSGVTFAGPTSWDYNVYSGSGVNYPLVANYGTSNDTLAQVQSLSTAREVHGRTGIPTYVNAGSSDFHLASSDTVATGAGVNLYSTYSFLQTDLDGSSRASSGMWNLGAYSSQSASSTKSTKPSPPTGLHAIAQ